jgi:hypothetical protein
MLTREIILTLLYFVIPTSAVVTYAIMLYRLTKRIAVSLANLESRFNPPGE